MVHLYKTKLLGGILLECILAGIIFFVPKNCLFLQWFHIPCAGCGMTRAFWAIAQFRIVEACAFHLLSIPLLILLISLHVSMLYDLLHDTTKTLAFCKQLSQYKFVILACVLISWGFQIIRYKSMGIV